MFFYSGYSGHFSERAIQELFQVGHKLLQAVCHVCLGFLSIRRALWHFLMLKPPPQHHYEKTTARAKLSPLHGLEMLVQLNETGVHLVDAVFMICVSLSHILKGALCLLISPVRSVQRTLVSELQTEAKELWRDEQKEGEEQKQRVKQYLMPMVAATDLQPLTYQKFTINTDTK